MSIIHLLVFILIDMLLLVDCNIQFHKLIQIILLGMCTLHSLKFKLTCMYLLPELGIQYCML